MKHFLNDVGMSVCPLVAVGQIKFVTGHRVYNQWYGYFDMETGIIKKAKMAMRNG